MHVQLWDISRVQPYPNNPRINNSAIDIVANSIREFGFRQPIVVDTQGVIVAGHTRYKAALKLRLDQIPVHVASELTEAQIRAYRIADNKTAEHAEWDYDLLPIELAELQACNFDLGLLGFDADELAAIMGSETVEGLTDPDDVPEPPDAAVTQPGDLWILGGHRLLCGDATNRSDVERVMNGEQADLWLTDPPYNIDYSGKTQDALKIKNDSMPDDAFRKFLVASFSNAFETLKPGATYYIWHADTEGYNFRGAIRDCNEQVRQCLIWSKNTMVMGRQDYHWQHEPCIYGWKSGASHRWFADRKQTTVLHFDRPTRSAEHPTMKPVALLAYQIRNSSAPQALVYDSFLGSGSTLIAAHQLKRKCYGLELDPTYCDVIVGRFQRFTGTQAVLERTATSPIPLRPLEASER